MKQQFTTADDGVRIAYSVSGTGALNVLLIHGWGGSAATWQGVLSYIDLNRIRAICISLRGHGLSGKEKVGALGQLARDVLAVANDAQARNFVLVGFSSGAKIAMLAGQYAPDRVLGQVLIGSLAPAPYIVDPETAASACDAAGSKDLFLEKLPPYVYRPVPQERLAPFLDDFVRAPRWALQMMFDVGAESFSVSTPQIPTLIIAGSHDIVSPPSFVKESLAVHFPHTRISVIESGHWMPFELPQDVAKLMTDFLSELSFGKRPDSAAPNLAEKET